MQTAAIVLRSPHSIGAEQVALDPPEKGQIVVDIAHSAISTGTERLLWSGEMPAFPGMGYPLIPGYESVGEVVEAPYGGALRAGDTVFVPGASCFGEIRGLFGASARRLVVDRTRVVRVDPAMGETGALLALTATALHALSAPHAAPPDLIIGHGVLGRLLARITLAHGAPPPTVWEVNADRRSGACGYEVLSPEDDPRHDYRSIYDASGTQDFDALIARLVKGGELVLAGFYAAPVSFAFPPAFMREARLRIAAEWTPADLVGTRNLIDTGALSLDGLVTHRAAAGDAASAYATAFSDPACLKMVLDWKGFS